MKRRLDQVVYERKLVQSRSEAESWIKLGKVRVDGKVVTRPGHFVQSQSKIVFEASERYVSRAGLKLASVAQALGVDFSNATVLDVGSSTGGFTDYALQHGAKKVYAVDVGTDQLHPSLRGDKRIELYEKTDIRVVNVAKKSEKNANLQKTTLLRGEPFEGVVMIYEAPDIVVMDVSFISLREILPHVATLCGKNTQIIAMLKPQFEAGKYQINKGVIKNDAVRREILKDFEAWAKRYFVLRDKKDSDVAGAKGNRERFYLLAPLLVY
jgi:23S rRNA (cytidine1920-2'-O)/16S rRNA (cytidine1409-2'-O)-methyltransferase